MCKVDGLRMLMYPLLGMIVRQLLRQYSPAIR